MNLQHGWRSALLLRWPLTSSSSAGLTTVRTGMMMDDHDEHVRRLIRQEMEAFINSHNWPDDEVMEALMEVAKNHVWKQGAYVRVKYWVNVIGFLGVIGGAVAMIVSVLGFEVVQK